MTPHFLSNGIQIPSPSGQSQAIPRAHPALSPSPLLFPTCSSALGRVFLLSPYAAASFRGHTALPSLTSLSILQRYHGLQDACPKTSHHFLLPFSVILGPRPGWCENQTRAIMGKCFALPNVRLSSCGFSQLPFIEHVFSARQWGSVVCRHHLTEFSMKQIIFIRPIIQIKKLRLREVSDLDQDCT